MPKRYKVLSDEVLSSESLRQRIYQHLDQNGCSDGLCPGCRLRIGCCHVYRGNLAASGYGRFHFRDGGENITYYVHRLIWALHHQEDPGTHEVQHRCDNRSCGRIEHLKLGHELENARDKFLRNRQYRGGPKRPKRGVRNGSKLTVRDRSDICRYYRTQVYSMVELARRYRVSSERIGQIVRPFSRRLRVKRLATRSQVQPYPAGSCHRRARLSKADVSRIKSLYEQRICTQQELASMYGLHKSSISLLVRGKTYAHSQTVRRVARGELQGLAKVTERQVKRLRRMYQTGHYSQQALAERFNLKQTTVSAIVRGFTWKHLL